jgi:hypothetical protein
VAPTGFERRRHGGRVVQLSRPGKSGPLVLGVALLFGLWSLATGVALISRSETAFGAVWSAFFVVAGVFFLSTGGLWVAKSRGLVAPPAREVAWEGEPARLLPRKDRRVPVTMFVLVLIGGWLVVMGVVGAVEESWLWPVLAAVPAVYVLGIPAFIVLGRFRGGGVWLTPTRLVHEQYGLRTEIDWVDVRDATPSVGEVLILPTEASAVRHQRLTPRMWCARMRPGEMVMPTEGVAGDCHGLAAEVRDRAAAVRSGR